MEDALRNYTNGGHIWIGKGGENVMECHRLSFPPLIRAFNGNNL